MSRTIHINLLKKTERRSPLPVRFRVMVPLLSCLMVLITLFGASLLGLKCKSLQAAIEDSAGKQDDLKQAHREFSELKERERVARMEVGQFDSYFGGRLAYSPVLLDLPTIIPLKMQLASLQITPPVRVLLPAPQKKGVPASAKDDKVSDRESVALRLAGLVDSASSIDALKAEFLSESFTNLVVGVEVPPGAFKASGGASAQYLFELNATFTERVFK